MIMIVSPVLKRTFNNLGKETCDLSSRKRCCYMSSRHPKEGRAGVELMVAAIRRLVSRGNLLETDRV